MLAEALLEAILAYLENFDLSWRESIGSIELAHLIYEFLCYSAGWPSEVGSALFFNDSSITINVSGGTQVIENAEHNNIETHVPIHGPFSGYHTILLLERSGIDVVQ